MGGLPELSNCYCHPGRAGGLPVWANVDRAVVEDYHNGLGSLVRPWAAEPVKGFKKGDKIGAAGWN